MRPGQQNKQRGRNRHRTTGGSSGGGGGGGNPLSRIYESNGPDVKVRGTAQTVAEKYLQLGRDALSAGDIVMAESYHQYAEHYLRLVAAAQAYQQQTQPQFRRPGEDDDDEDGDDGSDTTAADPRGQSQVAEQPDVSGDQPYEPERQPQQQQPYRQQRDYRDRDQNGQQRDYRDRDQANQQREPGNQQRDQGNQPRESYSQPREQFNQPRDQNNPQSPGRDRAPNRPRWQDRRDQPQANSAGEPRAAIPPPRAEEPPRERVETAVAASPVVVEDGQWEAPSFLRRPATLPPAEPVETAAETPLAAAPERKARAERKPRREKPVASAEANPQSMAEKTPEPAGD